MFLNTLTKKIEANCKITIFCRGIINLLFDGLAYNTCGHFAHWSENGAMGLGKILRNLQNIRAYYMLNHLIIHMKKLLDSDWLRAVQFKCNTSAKSVTPVQITHRNSGL